MIEQIAKIRSVRLGPEDHGIFTCIVDLDYGGSGQGAGMYAFDQYNPETKEREATAFGLQWIMRLMQACNVTDFSEIAGTTLIALREDGYHGKVIGFRPLPTGGGREFLFSELSHE